MAWLIPPQRNIALYFKETLGNQIRQEEENGNEAIKTRLEGLAGRFGMQIVPMSRDGNCLFASVGFSIMQRLSSTLSTVRQQYVNLGIQSTSTLECNSQTLRRLMTNEMKNNRNRYLPFLENVNDRDYDDLVTTFEQPGEFAGNIGDLMVKAITNVLKIPLVILTNITNYQVITVTPDEFNDNDDTIFLMYTRDGPGHYDALIESPQLLSQALDDQNEQQHNQENKCTCGTTRKQDKTSCANTTTASGRTYASRCPCLRAAKACGNLCKCKGCCNPLGKKTTERVEEQLGQKKRRRAGTEMSGERKDGSTYLKSENEEVTYGKWTDEENFVFLQHIVINPDILTADDHQSVVGPLTETFNASLIYANSVFEHFHVNAKTEKQIKKKLEGIRKQKELAYRSAIYLPIARVNAQI